MWARAIAVLLAVAVSPAVAGGAATGRDAKAGCPRLGRPAVAADPRPGALRGFAIQFGQDPSAMLTAASFADAIGCVMRVEVAPYLARGRPNLVVFDETWSRDARDRGARRGRAQIAAGRGAGVPGQAISVRDASDPERARHRLRGRARPAVPAVSVLAGPARPRLRRRNRHVRPRVHGHDGYDRTTLRRLPHRVEHPGSAESAHDLRPRIRSSASERRDDASG